MRLRNCYLRCYHHHHGKYLFSCMWSMDINENRYLRAMITWLTGMGQWWERANTTVDIVGAGSYRSPVCRSRDCREISKVAGAVDRMEGTQNIWEFEKKYEVLSHFQNQHNHQGIYKLNINLSYNHTFIYSIFTYCNIDNLPLVIKWIKIKK